MKDKNLHKKILKSYKRNHVGKYFLDDEEGKIYSQKIDVEKLEKSIENEYKNILKNNNFEQETTEKMQLIIEINKKIKSKAHKNRLKELKKNIEFN